MKILLFTDNHFTQYSSIIRSRGKKYSKRLENQIESLNWVNEIALEKGCEAMICLGDFFDKPELNSEELTALNDIKWNNLEKYFIVGNHEASNGDLSFNSVNVLASLGTVVYKPTLISRYGFDLFMLPYIVETDRKPLSEYLEDLYRGMFTTQECRETIILSHNDLKGIRFGQFESKNGFDINEIDRCCSLYVNGHLHNQQQISNKILNLGNLTGQNFSEDAEKYSHCVGVLDTESLKIELINNPYAFNFYKFEINSMNQLDTKLANICSNSIVSIKCPISIIDKVREDVLKNKNIIEYRVLSIPDVVNKSSDNISDILKLDHIDQFKTYIRQTLDNNELLEDELSYLN